MSDFENIKDQLDLKDFIEQETGTQASQVGTNLWRINPCPFCKHNDCFTIYEDTKSYHCFSCGLSGDVFIFVREFDNSISNNFGALIHIANKIGYQITNQKSAKQDTKLLDLKQIAVDYYHDNLINKRKDEPLKYLWDGQELETTVLKYQTEVRGHTLEVLKSHKIGYADGNLLRYMASEHQFSTEHLAKVGLTTTNGKDYFKAGLYLYPQFVNGRLSHFRQKDPIKQENRQAQKEHRSDYWKFYNQSVIHADNIVIVEGEDDSLSVIGKAKYPYVIATTGQLTNAQIDYLKQKRQNKRKYLCFDNDDGGRGYTDKIIRELPGYNIYIIRFCPLFKDIDELLSMADNPQELFTVLRENAVDVWSYRLQQIPPETSIFELLNMIKPLLVDMIKYLGEAHTEAFVNDQVKDHFVLTLNNLKPITKLIKESSKTDAEVAQDESEPSIIWADTQIGLDFSLAQDFIDDTLSYCIYLPMDFDGRVQLMPHLITSKREAILIVKETLTERGIYSEKFVLPSNMNRWSVDTKTDYNVHQFLEGSSISSMEVYKDLHQTFQRFIWHPDENLHIILSLWAMQSYMFMMLDSVGYLSATATKRAAKTRILELLEELCFNAMLLSGQTEAYTFRKIENNRVTLLLDEADRLAKQSKYGGTLLEQLRSGYKKTGKTGLCEGESHKPTEFSTYSMKAFANVKGIEEMLSDRVIILNPERKPVDVKVDRLLMRKETAHFQLLRNKLYTWALCHAKRIYDTYSNLTIPDVYHDYISDREEEIWAGLLTIAKVIDDEVNAGMLGLVLDTAKINKQRKIAEEASESLDSQFLEGLLDYLSGNPTPVIEVVDGVERKYYPKWEIEYHLADFFGWIGITSNKLISDYLTRLRILENVRKPNTIRKRVDAPVKDKDGRFSKDYYGNFITEEKRIMYYWLHEERIKEIAQRYDISID